MNFSDIILFLTPSPSLLIDFSFYLSGSAKYPKTSNSRTAGVTLGHFHEWDTPSSSRHASDNWHFDIWTSDVTTSVHQLHPPTIIVTTDILKIYTVEYSIHTYFTRSWGPQAPNSLLVANSRKCVIQYYCLDFNKRVLLLSDPTTAPTTRNLRPLNDYSYNIMI